MGRSLRPGAAVRRVYARFSSVTRHTQYVIRKQTILLLACAPLFGQQYTISTVAGGSAGAPLTNPTSVVVDASGNIYVGDWSGLIHKFWSRNGAVTTVAGTGVLGYSGDGGQATNAQIGRSINLALDGAGNLYIADGANNRIRRVELSTGIITTVTSAVTNPTGITVDTEERASRFTHHVRADGRLERTGDGVFMLEGLDVVAFHPDTKHVVHVEPSTNADSWRMRAKRYAAKFNAGRKSRSADRAF